jgi:hypothetical protein
VEGISHPTHLETEYGRLKSSATKYIKGGDKPLPYKKYIKIHLYIHNQNFP